MLPSRAAPVLADNTAMPSKVFFTVYDLDEDKRYKVFLLAADLPRLRVHKIRRTLCLTVPALRDVSFRLFSTVPSAAAMEAGTHYDSASSLHSSSPPLPIRCLEDEEVGAMFELQAGTILALQREGNLTRTTASVKRAASVAAVHVYQGHSSPAWVSTNETADEDGFSPVPVAPAIWAGNRPAGPSTSRRSTSQQQLALPRRTAATVTTTAAVVQKRNPNQEPLSLPSSSRLHGVRMSGNLRRN